jgi:hypothetical protein
MAGVCIGRPHGALRNSTRGNLVVWISGLLTPGNASDVRTAPDVLAQ